MPQLEGYSVRVIVAPDHVSRSPSSCPSWTILLFFLTLKVYSFVQRQNVKNYEWKPVKERWQIAVGLGKGGGWWWGDDLACPGILSKGE